MLNLYLLLLLFSQFLAGFLGFAHQGYQNILDKTQMDQWLANKAESITQNERAVKSINVTLETIHLSCPVLLSLLPSSATAIESSRSLSHTLKQSQQAIRIRNDIHFAEIMLKGFTLTKNQPEARKTNACHFAGPLIYQSSAHVDALKHSSRMNAGFKIEYDTTITWKFWHPRSRQSWF